MKYILSCRAESCKNYFQLENIYLQSDIFTYYQCPSLITYVSR